MNTSPTDRCSLHCYESHEAAIHYQFQAPDSTRGLDRSSCSLPRFIGHLIYHSAANSNHPDLSRHALTSSRVSRMWPSRAPA